VPIVQTPESVQRFGPDCHLAKNPPEMQLCGFVVAIVASTRFDSSPAVAGFSRGIALHQPQKQSIRNFDAPPATDV
jgi:hypothetical protein